MTPSLSLLLQGFGFTLPLKFPPCPWLFVCRLAEPGIAKLILRPPPLGSSLLGQLPPLGGSLLSTGEVYSSPALDLFLLNSNEIVLEILLELVLCLFVFGFVLILF